MLVANMRLDVLKRFGSAQFGAGEDAAASPEHSWCSLCSSTDSTPLQHASRRSAARPCRVAGKRYRHTDRQAEPRRAHCSWSTPSVRSLTSLEQACTDTTSVYGPDLMTTRTPCVEDGTTAGTAGSTATPVARALCVDAVFAQVR
jgi:hypothetical protein